MVIPPTLAAYYLMNYHTPEHSQSWGLWKNCQPNLSPQYHHDPDHILSNGERDIASVYIPVIGTYDSNDRHVCEYHILLAKATGINSFIVDWLYRPPNFMEITPKADLQILFTTAEKLDFKIALCFQDASCFPPWQPLITKRDQALEMAQNLLAEAETLYFKLPAYLRFGQRPVLTTLNQGVPSDEWHTPFFTPEEWQCIRKSLHEDIFLVQNYQPRQGTLNFSHWDSVYPWLSIYLSDIDTDEDYWEGCEKAAGQGRYQFVSGLVMPGYDDRGVGAWGLREPRVYSRRQGAKYIATWEDNLKASANFIQIGTWNNHCEGIGIEPVKEIVLHRRAASPGWGYRELIATREYAAHFTQRDLWPLPSLFLPERLYRLRKSGAPASRGDRIRLYLLEGDITGALLGLEHAGV